MDKNKVSLFHSSDVMQDLERSCPHFSDTGCLLEIVPIRNSYHVVLVSLSILCIATAGQESDDVVVRQKRLARFKLIRIKHNPASAL